MTAKYINLCISAIVALTGICSASAQTSKYELNVGDFTSLNLVDGINVEYKCHEDSAGYAVFNTSPQIADQLIFDASKKGVLKIEKAFHDENELVLGLPVIHVYSRFLTKVENAGDSTLVVEQLKSCPQFCARVIGNGRIVVKNIDCQEFEGRISTGNGSIVATGKCDKAKLVNVGSGSIQADRLEAKDASCRFFGGGTIGIWPTGTLSVKGMFPGKLYYRGEPQKIKNYGMGPKIIALKGAYTSDKKEPRPE